MFTISDELGNRVWIEWEGRIVLLRAKSGCTARFCNVRPACPIVTVHLSKPDVLVMAEHLEKLLDQPERREET
jgi:hypothetical protein